MSLTHGAEQAQSLHTNQMKTREAYSARHRGICHNSIGMYGVYSTSHTSSITIPVSLSLPRYSSMQAQHARHAISRIPKDVPCSLHVHQAHEGLHIRLMIATGEVEDLSPIDCALRDSECTGRCITPGIILSACKHGRPFRLDTLDGHLDTGLDHLEIISLPDREVVRRELAGLSEAALCTVDAN